jgi:chromatin assembly factor 1 subunit A
MLVLKFKVSMSHSFLQSPEMLKIKLKLLELEFEEEMKQKTERLKPRLFGCVWVDSKTADSGMLLLHLCVFYSKVSVWKHQSHL